MDRLIGEVQVYDEFQEDMLTTKFKMSREEFEHLTGRYHNIIERIKELTEERDDIIDIDVDYELESIKRIEVNYRYLVALLQAHMPEGIDAPKLATSAEDQQISKFIEDYKKNNPKVGEVLSQLWFEVKLNPENFRDKDAFSIMEDRVDELIAKDIQNFSAKWGVNPAALKVYANTVAAADISPKTVDTYLRIPNFTLLTKTFFEPCVRQLIRNPVNRLAYHNTCHKIHCHLPRVKDVRKLFFQRHAVHQVSRCRGKAVAVSPCLRM